MDKNKVYLYNLLSSALLQIREDAHESKNKKVFWISSLLHNLPKQLLNEDADYEAILNKMISNAEHDRMDKWLKNELSIIDEESGHKG